MTTPTIAELLRYANLQMAAEARLDLFSNSVSEPALVFGNNRVSKFPTTLARDFASKYEVLAHKANTDTGFSGTLFRDLGTQELILSFRSTEFIDDAVRDNQAANTMEVSEHGWAFGQIADMERWWAELNGAGGALAAGQPVTVTGYSLGGHLATADTDADTIVDSSNDGTFYVDGISNGPFGWASTTASCFGNLKPCQRPSRAQAVEVSHD